MRLVTVGIWYLIKPDQDEINFELKDGAVSLSYGAWLCGYRPIASSVMMWPTVLCLAFSACLAWRRRAPSLSRSLMTTDLEKKPPLTLVSWHLSVPLPLLPMPRNDRTKLRPNERMNEQASNLLWQKTRQLFSIKTILKREWASKYEQVSRSPPVPATLRGKKWRRRVGETAYT